MNYEKVKILKPIFSKSNGSTGRRVLPAQNENSILPKFCSQVSGWAGFEGKFCISSSTLVKDMI